MLKSLSTVALVGRILPLSFAICVLLAGIFHGIFSNEDPYRCGALLKNGSWLHEPNEKGDRKPFTNWQPDGCMLRQYDAQDIKDCIGDRHVVFSGDSTTRQVFWGMARLLDRKKAEDAHDHAEIHASYNMTFGDIRMLQIWNPMFDSGELNPELTEELELLSKEKHHPVPIDEQKSAAMIMLGAGSWYVLLEEAPQSLTKFQSAFNNITDLLHLEDLPKFGTTPMDPVEGVGNEIFVAPIAVPFYNDLPKDRTGPKGIHKGEVEDIDKWLAEIGPQRNLRMLDSFPALSRGQPEAMVDRSQTGFHVIDSVAEIKATILLNARCNAKLDRLRGYAYNRTCCTDYGSLGFVQIFIVGLTTLYVLACAVFETLDITSGAEAPRMTLLNMKIGIFPTSLLFCYFADRTQLFAKGNKELVNSEFITLTVFCVVIAILSIRRTQFRPSRTPAPPATAAPAKEDAGIMSRDQTEEWKGWMQAVILIYHWTGASKHLEIYMFVRLLVAAYLFQTGYGHTIYFLAKKDFSFRRVAAVLLRLNILSCALPYVMNTDYMFYYFAPLVSFWFLIVYFTLAIGSRFNDNTNAVLSKINICLVLVWIVLKWTPLNSWIFSILQTIFRIDWNLHEWEFRVQLDGVIVFVGMIAGVIQQRVERNSSWLTNYKTAILPAMLAICGYAAGCAYNFDKKETYNSYHPYLSFIPIVAFIVLRNAFTPLRNLYSTAAAWLGRCSLETFILQYHIYLAADTRGVLLLDVFRGGDGSLIGDRWRDLVAIVPIFIWLSHCVSESSGLIVKLLTAKPKETAYDAEDEELKIEEPSYGVFNNTYVTRISRVARWMGSDLRINVVGMLLGMWLLNLFY